MMHKLPGVALIGCGRVGCAIALGLKRAGYPILNVADIDPKAVRRARRLLRLRTSDYEWRSAGLVLIATPDSQIAEVYRQIAPSLRPDQTVVHFSGALGSDILGPVTAGFGRLALHPVMTIQKAHTRVPGPRSSSRSGLGLEAKQRGSRLPPNCWFALEGNPKGLAVGRRLVKALNGRMLVIRARDKVLFHAACVFASNLTDVVLDAGFRIAANAGLTRRQAREILMPLAMATMENIARTGTVPALTGPVERGDAATVQRHLAVLKRAQPGLLSLYQTLSAHAMVMAGEKGKPGAAAARRIRALLGPTGKGRPASMRRSTIRLDSHRSRH